MMDALLSPDGFLIGALALIGGLLVSLPFLDARHERRKDRPGARTVMYRDTMILLWAMAILAWVGWLLSGRPLADIGWAPVVQGWRGLAAWGVAGLILAYCAWQLAEIVRSPRSRRSARKQISEIQMEDMRPRTKAEAWGFQAVSVTAGVTEEIIFRGVAIAAFALVMPLWAAAALSLVVFTLAHAYQGPAGLLRVAPTGALLTAIVLLGGSLWPAILAHAVIDMTAGLTFALLDRFDDKDLNAAPDLAGPDPDTSKIQTQ